MADTGIRRSELLGMDCGDLLLDEQIVTVLGSDARVGFGDHAPASRSGPVLALFVIVLPDEGDDNGERDEVERMIREVLETEPDTYTKTALAEKMPKRKKVAHQVIAELQRQGIVVPDGRGAKLRLAEVPDACTYSSAATRCRPSSS